MTDNPEKIIVCRCADVSLKEINDLLEQGITDMDDIKRLSRAGMGQCQGKTCRNLIMGMVAKKTNTAVGKVKESRYRPPAVAIPLGLLTEEDCDEE